MSWYNQISRRGALAGLLALGACGFHPALGNFDQADLSALRGRISLPNAVNAETFALRNELVSYFGEPSQPEYALKVTYRSKSASLAITQNAQVTRYRITASGSFTITRLSDNQVLLERPFHRVASYSANADQFAADQTRAGTQERLARSVADEIAMQTIIAIANSKGQS